MGKTRKPMSEEHKAKLRVAREAAMQRKKEALLGTEMHEQYDAAAEDAGTAPKPNQVMVDADVIQQLIAKVAELEKQKNPNMTAEAALATTATMQGYDINVGNKGIQGRVFKYPVEKAYYEDPTQRLYEEPSLSRFNLRENFYFDWDVEGVEYEKYGVTYAEPRFTVRLFRKIYADDGTLTKNVALVNRAIMHEDEVVARIGAEKLGIQDKFQDFKHMMNEMRYHRFRSWLMELFTPAKVEQHRGVPHQTVIDGKVVEMFDSEVIIDKGDAESKSSTIQQQVRI